MTKELERKLVKSGWNEDTINDLVDDWYNSTSTESGEGSLRDFVGFSDEEYLYWMKHSEKDTVDFLKKKFMANI